MAGLQKLLHPGMSAQVFESGYDRVGGFVIDVADANSLPTPEALLAAYRLGGDWGEWVDVVRFAIPACAQVTRPAAVERPWPSYPTGFLAPVGDAIVPVWSLSLTRYSPGAELWRIHRDGRQEMMLWYAGAARGWVGARGWRPASRFVGSRATWNDVEYAADVTGDAVELTAFQEQTDPAWTQHRPQTWSRTVPVAECEISELIFGATVNGVAVRILEANGDTAQVLLVGDDPADAQRIGADLIDPGVFVNPAVPAASLENRQLVANVRRR
ncbi:hypothetical protein [Pseudolysinimonas sp.]|uniref:hypothetical protein n=1 Tax=Pseudolysinimonas sp. TaxID=2680009 RepID=UPI0037847941